jgi:hypothetical protein
MRGKSLGDPSPSEKEVSHLGGFLGEFFGSRDLLLLG